MWLTTVGSAFCNLASRAATEYLGPISPLGPAECRLPQRQVGSYILRAQSPSCSQTCVSLKRTRDVAIGAVT